jgi:hypothetical protein
MTVVELTDSIRASLGLTPNERRFALSIPEKSRQIRYVAQVYPQSRRIPLPDLTGLPPRLEVPHRGFVIEPQFAPDHPNSPFHIYLDPCPSSRHYYVHPGEKVPRLCWCSPANWSERWPLIVGVTAAMRFIDDYLAHRVD